MATAARSPQGQTRQGIQTRATVAHALYYYSKEHARPPTLREVCVSTGLRSLNAAWYHLQRLRSMGVVRHLGGARGYALTENWLERLYPGGEGEPDDAGK